MTTDRRKLLFSGALAGGTLATPAIAQSRVRWRMITGWIKNLPGPGVAAAHIARRVKELSDGRFELELFAAGEIVPALQIFDAVSNGTVEMGHAAAFYWVGKIPASVFFTSIPFGPGPIEHQTWIERGGGQALWDELYAPFGVRPVLAGNTGPSMGGWFKKPLASAADAQGLRIRVQGLGADVWQRLGATPMSLAPGELLQSLTTGVVDAAEFLSPLNDLPLGLWKAAPHYHAPGFNKPNGAAEALFNTKAYDALPGDFKAMLHVACAEAHARGLTEAEAGNGTAMLELIQNNGVQVHRFPADLVRAARLATDDIVNALAARNDLSARIRASLQATRQSTRAWRRVGISAASAMLEE